MKRPFNMPDEFVQAFLKAGQDFWEGQTWQASFLGPIESQGQANPTPTRSLADLPMNYCLQQLALWTDLAAAASGQPVTSTIDPERGDRRFSAAEWRTNPAYSLLKQNYLLNSRLIRDLVESVDLGEHEKRRVRFYARQFVESMSPTNFAAINPDVLKLALETGGESLKVGFEKLLADMSRGSLTITDEAAFEVGKNLAVSEGAVVFENELFQLIQYAPRTEIVAERPLVIVPPCINKFYILDLQPENSFVRFAVEQGLTLFVVSWRNPDVSCAYFTWDDYVEGTMTAIATALSITDADKVNALGWCVGGTILSSALAIMRARGVEAVASLTLLTTMLDFEDPGELGVFIDEQGVRQREQTIGQGGLYHGAELGFVFQTLRGNDLIWPNVINNYLKGKNPPAFDLLYWNSDATNLSGPMYAWYLRNMYLENNLRVPDRLTMCGTPVDLGLIDMPAYVLATQDDHIVPWRSAYRTTRLVRGKSQFVLGASGHIAGVINPASKNKRRYWVDGAEGDDADKWLASSTETPGSWWSHWAKWLAPMVAKNVAARRVLGDREHPVIEPAPGRYVKAKAI
jgi:polyhydroxyalkanoate synthase subunit PhaC